jgi:hypothetical protein
MMMMMMMMTYFRKVCCSINIMESFHSHGGDCKQYCLWGCNAVKSDNLLTYRRKITASIFRVHPVDGGGSFLRNWIYVFQTTKHLIKKVTFITEWTVWGHFPTLSQFTMIRSQTNVTFHSLLWKDGQNRASSFPEFLNAVRSPFSNSIYKLHTEPAFVHNHETYLSIWLQSATLKSFLCCRWKKEK